MTDRLLDDLGRTLARPMTRRRTMRLFAAGAVAAAIPPLRPRAAFSQTDDILCYSGNEFCRDITCPDGTGCCYGPPDQSSVSQCPTNPHCCDPCDPTGNKCDDSTGYCYGDSSYQTCTACCQKQKAGEPKSGAPPCSCCAAGEIFTGSTGGFHTGGRCCKPARGRFRSPCGIREGDCAEHQRNDAEKEMDVCDANFLGSALEVSFKKASAQYRKCLSGVNNNFTRRMRRCPQSPDPDACREGVCGSDLRCDRECANPPPIRAVRRSGREQDLAFDRARDEGASTSASVSAADLRKRIKAAKPRLDRAFRHLEKQLRVIPVRGDLMPQTDLADAYHAYSKEIRRLRNNLAKGDGGRPQQLALSMLDASLDSNAAFESAARARTIQKQQRLHKRGMKALTVAGRRAPAASKALGCGKSCG
jgi:hypothetical protein